MEWDANLAHRAVGGAFSEGIYRSRTVKPFTSDSPKNPCHRNLVLLLVASALSIHTAVADPPAISRAQAPANSPPSLFARENLIAWCIVPFDSKKRTPEQRAAMLQSLGFRHFAYDWRAEHIPTFDAEVEALNRHGIALDAFWLAPGELNRESRIILDLLARHQLKTQLWVLLDFGADKVTGPAQERREAAAAEKLAPLAVEAHKIGCSLALYNHGGWFGEPENQIAIIKRLQSRGITNVGIVYNLHHGHDHLDRFPALLDKIKPYLLTLNLNGMDPAGDRHGRKILPLGQGSLDLQLLKTIEQSGYKGPIGILGHTQDDAEERLKDNLDGLDWLLPQLAGKPAGPRPTPRTPVPPAPVTTATATTPATSYDPSQITRLLADARAHGDPARGAAVFASPKFACISCHKVGNLGGAIGPELTTSGLCIKPEELVESLLYPKRQVKQGYEALSVVTEDGKLLQGYHQSDSAAELVLRDPASGTLTRIPKTDIAATRVEGSLMPEGLAAAMTESERRDLVRFMLELGKTGNNAELQLAHQSHTPAEFPFDPRPIHPERWPQWQHPVNRERVYQFYTKEAQFFLKQSPIPSLLPQFPGLDGGRLGHWGNQNDTTWADDRWNRSDLGNLLCGVFRGAGVVVPKGVCIRLGDRGELSACFNPQTLTYDAAWQGGFVKFSATRHGLMDGLIMDGTPLPLPKHASQKPAQPFIYHGFYRYGNRIIFSYKIGTEEFLDAPWTENGRFTRVVAPAKTHPLAHLTKSGGPARWPQVLNTKGTLGKLGPYAVDTIDVPFQNPWNALMFFGDHDFKRDGTAFICTIQGDVYRVEGLDQTLEKVRWKRFATGLHQALGLTIKDDQIFVLGRDQITRLVDLDQNGEADFHECVSNVYETSPGGHDFICGLERDPAGRFYTASSKQGVMRIAADGRSYDTLATGFRNPDGVGLSPEGVITVPSSEGEWTPASMISEIKPGGHYGYGGPRGNQPPDLPLVYMPRGLDNSSSSQVTVPDSRFGPLNGQMLHFSFGTGTYFLLLREKVGDQPQGAAVPMPGEFRSGSHRGRFNPRDGQLYVSGMTGWGTYTPDDGSFQRVRYTGEPVQLPLAYHAHENGILLTFSRPLDPQVATRPDHHLAQAWNYHYAQAYGSPEMSTRHPGLPGHDVLTIRSAHILEGGTSLFLEIPDLQPVNQLHLHVQPDSGEPVDLFATVHRLAPPFTGFTGYQPANKVIAAHPILADMIALNQKPIPNPHRSKIKGERLVTIEAGKNLSFSMKSFKVHPDEPIRLLFLNPDAVPHNWALIKPGTLARVGDQVNQIIAQPDAALRQYIPRSTDILAYTDIVPPQEQFAISFRAPKDPGRYPYLCTFPGHWMVMNGEMIVE
jgi:putative heme-binding domain-containing protein